MCVCERERNSGRRDIEKEGKRCTERDKRETKKECVVRFSLRRTRLTHATHAHTYAQTCAHAHDRHTNTHTHAYMHTHAHTSGVCSTDWETLFVFWGPKARGEFSRCSHAYDEQKARGWPRNATISRVHVKIHAVRMLTRHVSSFFSAMQRR